MSARGRTRIGSRVYRSRLQHHFPAVHQLPRRHVPLIRCKCDIRQYTSEKRFGGFISPGSCAHVQ